MKSLDIALSVVSIILTTAALARSNDAQRSSEQPRNPANPISAFNKYAYGGVKAMLLRRAEKMPEENYNFKPTDTVLSYGQIVGHVADAQYLFCSIALRREESWPENRADQDFKSRPHRCANRKPSPTAIRPATA